MCGIFGVFNSNASGPKKLEDFVKDCLIAGTVRGADSTGLLHIDAKRTVYHHKLAQPGVLFQDTKLARGLIDDADIEGVTIGHNRKATMGKVTQDNAHPFFTADDKDGNFLCGVHNGTLDTWRGKPESHKYDVDSEWLFNHLRDKGMDAFKDFKGAFALMWYDSREPDTINFARNDQRPLYYTYLTRTLQGKTERLPHMLLASEHGMLSWLAARNELSIENDIYIVEPGFHYAVDMKDVRKFTKTALPKEVVVPVTNPRRSAVTGMYEDENDDHYGWAAGHGSRYSSGYQYDGRAAKERLFKAIDNAIGGAPATKEPTLNAPAVPLAEQKSKGPYPNHHIVTQVEFNNADALKEVGEVYTFYPTIFDEQTGELYGTIEIADLVNTNPPAKPVVMPAVIRKLDAGTARRAVNGDYQTITGKVCGVRYGAHKDDVECEYVLGYPHLKLATLSRGAVN